MEQIGAAIIAGGESRRMGKDKAQLRLEGQTFLQRVAGQLGGFGERLLSVGQSGGYALEGFREIRDLHAGIGPIAGLFSALRCCESDWLLTVSCDMPLFSRALADYLVSFVDDAYDALVVVTRDGRLQPLCAVYAKPAADILEGQIASGNYSLMRALGEMKIKLVSLRHSAYPDETVSNVNCPEDYRRLRRRLQGPPVVAVSGVKNSGKTTLLEGLIPALRAHGIERVAVIKHDGHDFAPDVPGTDSFRLRAAGAQGVAVYSDRRFFVTMEQQAPKLDALLGQFDQADLILLEGGKHTAYPKIEVVRSAVSSAPVCAPETLLGVYTDLELRIPGVPSVALGDVAGAAALVAAHLGREGW